MEYGLRGEKARSHRQVCTCLNPCFNGIWSERAGAGDGGDGLDVLILVLMEYGLRDQY